MQGYCFGQADKLNGELANYASGSDHTAREFPSEKAFIHFDKANYTINDTICLKAYLFNDFLTPSDKSGILNIDIANDSNKVIKQYRLPVQYGLSWGSIAVDEKEFAPGTYILRAYTNWMRNFGSDYFYYKTFYVSSGNENNLLVNPIFDISSIGGSQTVNARMLFSDVDKIPYRLDPLSISVVNGKRTIYRQNLQTGVGGDLNMNFKLPEKSSGLAIIAESAQKDRKAVIPVILNRPEKADVQFLPEGGNLVAGLPARIGFKAVGEDGRGIEISGTVVDHEQKKVAEFKSMHNGMGSFELPVTAGETYAAKISFADGRTGIYPLPAVKALGTTLRVKNPLGSDSVEVTAAITSDFPKPTPSYFLIGRARGIVCYAAVVDFRDGFIRRKIAKRLFPTGIAHFTLMTAKYEPVNERLVFIDRHDNLDIKFSTDKSYYDGRESVNLKFKVTDKDGKPVKGNFSLAVTDDAQVKTDSTNYENIINRMLLTSDLKGYIEQPGYYLSNTSAAWRALDNLLLTQGWIGYNWQNELKPPAVTYQPELEFEVSGKVLNIFNKPLRGTNVLLFSKSPFMLGDTLTNNEGRFKFSHFPRVDTPVFVLKAVNKNGKSFNVSIAVDEVKPPDFVKPAMPAIMPWYVNSDTTLLNYTKANALIKQNQSFPAGGHILKEVKISAKKVVKGSQNLNGPGNADLVLDEKDLEKAEKKTWLQLLEENIKGFRDGYFMSGLSSGAAKGMFLAAYVTDLQRSLEWYFIKDKPIKLIVDGISVTQVLPSSSSVNASFIDMREYLKSHSAEDIKGLEVISSTKYASEYFSRFEPHIGGEPLSVVAMKNDPPVSIGISDIAFIEITTRSGHGPIIGNTPGMYLYKPLPISWPKQFYKPKYAVKDTANHSLNRRSTIDWEPNITTDANGEASLWFYAADKPTTYTLIIEGADMIGSLGYRYGKIIVGKPKEKAK